MSNSSSNKSLIGRHRLYGDGGAEAKWKLQGGTQPEQSVSVPISPAAASRALPLRHGARCRVSSRVYNVKDYNYISSFPHAGAGFMQQAATGRQLVISQMPQGAAEGTGVPAGTLCTEDLLDADIDDTNCSHSEPKRIRHVSFPKFGAWNLEASSNSEGYTAVFDRARQRKKGITKSLSSEY
ncbi:hypothetical protein GOP47_0019437 [Adiantum capillus-veneris]|uniref:RIN4 pathogenic type III effector avirulence factor Avr cleavage site domain-containing protein n=1 Tax=Adiantum capillus-veneris TaxID=13818 RepID=A0A9D4UBH2_ADICA|nr:hypothetical protein GOP47_0019437 [Adiantum capillus-veneris]